MTVLIDGEPFDPCNAGHRAALIAIVRKLHKSREQHDERQMTLPFEDAPHKAGALRWSPDQFAGLLTRLGACGLDDEDRGFVEGLRKQFDRVGNLLAVALSDRQIEQLRRMEGQYL